MEGVTLLLIIAGVLAVLVLLVVAVGLMHGPAAFYVRRDGVFSRQEIEMLHRLESAHADRYRVLPKMALNQIVSLKRRMSRRTRRLAWNRICAQQFDYVLADSRTLEPAAAVVLTDGATSRTARRRLVFLRKVCKAIGLPLIELEADSAPIDPASLADFIEQAMTAPSQAPAPLSRRQEPALAADLRADPPASP